MKYYIQVLSKWYAFVCTFISYHTKNAFMVDKIGFQGMDDNALSLVV